MLFGFLAAFYYWFAEGRQVAWVVGSALSLPRNFALRRAIGIS
jgi:hypothetical protein